MAIHTVSLDYHASGCVTQCLHCARNSGPSPMMDLTTIEELLAQIAATKRRFAQFEFDETPMFEPLAHPDPARVNELRLQYLGTRDPVISTSGPALALRDDWREQLLRLQAMGTELISFTIHGRGLINDRIVSRPGAYEETKLALRRVAEAGLKRSLGVMLNAELLEDFEPFIDDITTVGYDEIHFQIPSFLPLERLRRYEELRPDLAQIEPHRELMRDLSPSARRSLERIPECTESAHVAKATMTEAPHADWEGFYDDSETLSLVVLQNLDVCDGDLRYPRYQYGNLGQENLPAILDRAIEAKESGRLAGSTDPVNFFEAAEVPTLAEVVGLVGDPQSTKLHMRRPSIQLLWLDRYFAGKQKL